MMTSRHRHAGLSTFAVALTAAIAAVPASASAADFYAGKSIELIIGAAPGGGYDVYARTFARHFARHVPGTPAIVPKNMPGAGSARAAGFVSNVAPKDGTTIGSIMPGPIMNPLLEPKAEVLFDPVKLVYLGNANNGARVCVTRKDSSIKTFDDLLTHKAVFGAIATNDSTRDYGYLHKHTSGALYDLVSGYKGTNDITLAMERGEVDGMCGWDWSSMKSQKPAWVKEKQANILLQVGLEPNEELTALGVPHVYRYVKDGANRKVVDFIISQQLFQRPFIVPSETPADRVEILRRAFAATMRDPQFLADAEKVRIDIAPIDGAQVQDVVRKLYAAPKDIVERAQRAINP
jgi:tripartite-type tricarboxylate transporter receptor subunit TctC